MSDRAGDILLIGGFLAIAWAWLRTRMGARGSVEIGMPIIHGPMPGISGGGGATGGAPDLSDGFSISAPDWPTDYFGGSFMPTATPPATQAAPVPQVDPLEKQYLARTIWGEARGEGRAGMRAVAAVIMNRVADRRYPSTVKGVVLQRWQFSMWNDGEPNGIAASAVTTADAAFRDALLIAEDALTGKLADPTGGATHYYSPAAMVPPGSVPPWAKAPAKLSTIIGKHHFWTGVS